MPIDPADLDPDPVAQLEAWLADAEAAGLPLATAFALATTGTDGEPTVRMILLRGLDRDGLRFYTNRGSRKGSDLAANPRASAVFHWAPLSQQILFACPAQAMDDPESAAYWSTRLPTCQLFISASE